MAFNDLREFIKKADDLGECLVVEGADWDLEIGAIASLRGELPNCPLLVFDKIKGYEAGYRVASNLFTTNKRIALAMDLPLEAKGVELVRAFRDKIREGIKPLPPVEVETGPVKENILTGDDVDLFKFPSPKWHEGDGGRYIGTGSTVITRDPDEGWVDLGCRRVQVHDKSTATIWFVPSTHGHIIKKKYEDRGQTFPVAVTCGQEPALWIAAAWPIPWGISEYDFAGGIKGKPIEITRGVTTDLPIPATAEIVLEGEMVPETRMEGPFGERAGYYASGSRPEWSMKVKSILYRNEPIIQGAPPHVLPSVWTLTHIQRAADLWNELDRYAPGIKGVWMVEEAAIASMVVISLKQQYPGHAKQVAMAACTCSTFRNLQYVVTVDEDIDPSNTAEVLWAIGTRTDPEVSIDIIRGTFNALTSPMLSPEKIRQGDFTLSTAIINACKPYHWIKEFPPTIKTSPELAQKIKQKWSNIFRSP